MRNIIAILAISLFMLQACNTDLNTSIAEKPEDLSFTWNNANIYFLLTDRFENGRTENDINFDRTSPTAVNRGFQGGDIAGVTKKINEGYFSELGISAIWLTPFFEQIHGLVDEGTGETYAYHGYWTKDWTALDPNFGSEEELIAMLKAAHKNGIRVIMDVIINHTGPVTEQDPVWENEWVRTTPPCTYQGYKSTVECTLVENLPDIKTELEEDIALPSALLNKWEKEGRLDQELAELDTFFEETGYPRAPKYYIIKWLTDYIREYGINAYRLDTAKHTEEDVWSDLRKEADRAYKEYKAGHPGMFFDDENFYMVGEVYNYGISGGRNFDIGDTLIDYYAEGIDHLINFQFKYDAKGPYETMYSAYSDMLHNALKGKGVVNYISSHDDGDPFDKMRERALEAASKLLLCPGASQVYYGDETSRILFAEGANGDANLRSFMNWQELEENKTIHGVRVNDVLSHYQKLGVFRTAHPAVGAGIHEMISESPYIFQRVYSQNGTKDIVIVGLDLPLGKKNISIGSAFDDGTILCDSYSGKKGRVKNGMLSIDSEYDIVLLGLF